jgi:hypothetical protein
LKAVSIEEAAKENSKKNSKIKGYRWQGVSAIALNFAT